jgi:hypothetical protein
VSATQRTNNRDSLFLMAKLRFVGGPDTREREVRVRNLSEGGMMAEVDRVVDNRTPVSLDIRGIGAVPGKVAWCTAGRIGIAFDFPIDPQKARKPVGQGATTPGYAKPMGLGAYRREGGKDPGF